MGSFNLTDVVDQGLYIIANGLESVVILVAGFWAVYQMIGVLRGLLGYKSEKVEEQ